ncbi:amidohydrolase family protein [Flavihumibacter fluvii]|uniref:amidohydrolase family protein n=1 Tax=Flavihumibacter fluvii TaxID=2838157 RepID=UPI001BDF35C6|nr:amidohydrolase family protein [Flavihumibacter fluvii]ULQ53185.1 amidohydrolase [Flavihumibacter fluvii]
MNISAPVYKALLIPGCFLLLNCSTAPTNYTAADFTTVEKFDTHVHINADDTTFISQARKDNLRLLTVNVDAEMPIEVQRDYALKLVGKFPDEVQFATTFNLKDWGTEKWLPQTIAYLQESIEKGAIAVKIWKNIGMELKDADGKWVMIDDARFDSVLNFIEKSNITLIGHLGEPRNAWLAIDQMTILGDKNYFREHPQYHQFLHPENPSYEDQINARDNMLRKHPNLRFVGAHLGSLEWNVDELAKRLDQFPNMAVDMAARIPHLQVQSVTNRQKVHDFMVKYQDRLIYATDHGVDTSSNLMEVNQEAHQVRMTDWKFFATDEELTVPHFTEKFRGLQLPKEVIDKIYRTNAEKWFPGINYQGQP